MTAKLSAQHALAIVEHCSLPLLVTDRQGRVISYNQAFERLVGGDQASELQGAGYADLGDHPARMLLGPETSLCWTDHDAIRHCFEVQDIDLPDDIESNDNPPLIFIAGARQQDQRWLNAALRGRSWTGAWTTG